MSRLTIGSGTRLAGVLGWPVAHSKSPAMHNAGFAAAGIDAAYLALPVAPQDLEAAVRGLRAVACLGASITVPHKTAVMALCDTLSETAQAIGAVNTLEFRDSGQLVGHNTDAPGYVQAISDATGASIAGRRVVLLGGGGAARAVAHGVLEAGASDLRLIARTPAKVDWISALAWEEAVLAAALLDCDLLIDCTSMGLDEASEARVPARPPVERLPAGSIVSTLVYHRETALMRAAKKRGLVVVTGAGMLLFQGAIAFEIWTGAEAPLEAMRAALGA